MIRSLSRPRGHRGSRAVGLLIALALTALTSVLSAGPAVAAELCGTPSTSGGYSVTACTDYDYSSGYIYVTLPAGHANCTIRGKIVYDDTHPPRGYAQTWTCPAGAITNVRYDIDFAPNGAYFTTGGILNSSGTTIVSARSDF